MPLNGFDWNVSSGLAQGISNAGQGLAQGIARLSADLKKTKAYRTMAIDALGMDPEQVDKMSLPQLEGQFQAMAVKNAMAGVKQRQQAEADRAAYNAEVARMMEPQIQPDAPAGMILEDGGQPTPGAPAAPAAPGFDPMRFMGAAARHNQLSPEMVAKIMRPGGDGFSFDPNKDVVPIPQIPGTFFSKTSTGGGQILQDPTAIAAAAAAKEKAKIRDMTPRDALRAYNDNQGRISQIQSNLKLAEDPTYSRFYDVDALNAELADIAEQQAILRPRFGGKTAKPKPEAAPESTYKSADEVRAAVRGKKLDRTAALKILKEQFGLK